MGHWGLHGASADRGPGSDLQLRPAGTEALRGEREPRSGLELGSDDRIRPGPNITSNPIAMPGGHMHGRGIGSPLIMVS